MSLSGWPFKSTVIVGVDRCYHSRGLPFREAKAMPHRTLGAILQNQELLHTTPDTSVQAAALKMAERNVAAILIIEDAELLGIFTERDLLRRVVAKGLNPLETPVGGVMTSDVVTLHVNATGFEAVRMMREQGVRHIVVSGLNETGYAVASIRDFLSSELANFDREIEFEHRLWEEL